ncbi:MAG TPA: PDZ domain-containing protein, partial [Kofleriaceae bacterium]|nr:PDZ domain-containing protein [Kofleriaceae bacterium]
FEGKQIVLAAPLRRGYRHRDRDGADRDGAAMYVRSAAAARQADTLASGPAPVDPYAEPAIRVVEAPGAAPRPEPAGAAARAIEAGEGGVRVVDAQTAAVSLGQESIRVVEAPTAATPGSPAIEARPVEAPPADARPADVRAADTVRVPDQQTLDARAMADVMSANVQSPGARRPASVSSNTAPHTVAADPGSAAQVAPVPDTGATSAVRTVSAASSEAVILTRADVDGALADFAKLAAALRGRFSADGLVVDGVRDGTIFQRAGLRAGDVITSVDGAPLHSLDDAANLYARASSTKAITAQILRGGKLMTVRVAIQ